MSATNFSRDRVPRQAGSSQHRPWSHKKQSRAWPIDFRHPDDAKSRKANHRCVLKARIFNAWRFIGTRATARQIAQLLHLPLRTVEWGVALLKRQKFVANVRKHGLNGPMEVEFRILRSSTGETCGVKASRKLHTEKEKQDTHDNARQKPAVAFERDSNPTVKSKPFRTPRQVFAVAERLIGPEYASWLYYRALRCGRIAGKTFAQCVPKSTAYYVKGYRNFCIQYGPQQHQAILENALYRMKAEEDLWMLDRHEYFGALNRIPRRWQVKTELPLQACDAVTFGGGA
jgi:hypothetical protein